MFEARLAGNLQGSPKYWYHFPVWFARCFVILSAIYRSFFRFRSRGIETTLRTLVESHEERGKKHWRIWEVATRWGNDSEVHIFGGGLRVDETFYPMHQLVESVMCFCRFWKIHGIFYGKKIIATTGTFVAFSSTKSRCWFQILLLSFRL